MQPLAPLLFHNFRDGKLLLLICHPYIPLEMTCFTDFWLRQCTIYNTGAKKRFVLYILHYWPSLLIPPFLCSRIFFVMQHARIELRPHRYDTTLLTSTLCYTRARGRSRRGTLSKMASFIVDSEGYDTGLLGRTRFPDFCDFQLISN